MEAECVRFNCVQACRHSRFPEVVGTGSLGRRPYSVAPMVTVSETSTRPAQIGRPKALHVIHKLLANSIDVRDFRFAPYPDSVIDHSAQMFDEVAVDMWIDDRPRLLWRQLDFCIGRQNRPAGCQRTQHTRSKRLEQYSSIHPGLLGKFPLTKRGQEGATAAVVKPSGGV